MGPSKKASEIAALLNLRPHPDGGFYLETLRDSSITLARAQLPSPYKVDRPISTAIYFLLPAGSVAYLHRIPCAETFHFYMGEPLTILELKEDGVTKMTVLGLDLEAGERPQYTVPPNVWFGTYPMKDISVSPDGNSLVKAPRRDAENHFSLVGVTCAPAFQFEDSVLANCLELIPQFPKMEFLISYLTSPN
ncbi:hypothetical protein NE237_025642 [Protea cynaroides]|uniref:DUF985 domain-containing protein n=1 Tax=Protea cynaroides TaxID=273540 RepID=A0A9Q0K0D6_9MAGN|nr:hypothetical protein NE237_025642 [Protea cynaroides]